MKVAKGVNLKSSHHKKEKRNFVTLYGMVGNQIYCPDHFAVYTNNKSLCWTPKNTWIKKEKLIKPLHLITVTILWNNCNFLRKKKQFYENSSIVFCIVQSLSRVQLCGPMHCSISGFPVLHYLPEIAHTHVHWVGDAIQPAHPLLTLSPLALNLSHHQGLFQWVGSLY